MGNQCCSGSAAAKAKPGWQPVVDVDGVEQNGGGAEQKQQRSKKRIRYHTSQLFSEDYELEAEEILGSGYNGMVKVCVSRVTGERCAVKSFTKQVASKDVSQDPKKKNGEVSPRQQLLKNECEIYLALDHPNIARLIDVYEDQFSIYFVMELCSGGELYARLIAQKQYTESMAQAAVKQMLLAANYLHHHGIVHRDLKLENFLYWNEDSDVLKMIDFGFSHVLGDKKPVTVACGSISYMAPEVIASATASSRSTSSGGDHRGSTKENNNGGDRGAAGDANKNDKNGNRTISAKVDMWSLGVITFMLLAGYPPFSATGEAELLNKIQNANYIMVEDRWRNVSPKGRDFVEKLLVVSHAKRMSADEALHHPWITEGLRLPSLASADTQVTWGVEVLSGIREFATASHFKRACLSMMAWGLTPKERAQVRDLFFELDREGEGYVTLEDFKHALQEHYPHQVASEEMIRLFNAVDTDHCGRIYYSDFLATMLQFRLRVHDSLLRHTFNQLDVDRQGLITVENLRTILGKTFEGEQTEECMREVKGDRHGQITYEDFCKFLGFDGGIGKTGDINSVGARAMSREVMQEIDKKMELQEEIVSKLYHEDSRGNVHVPSSELATQTAVAAGGSVAIDQIELIKPCTSGDSLGSGDGGGAAQRERVVTPPSAGVGARSDSGRPTRSESGRVVQIGARSDSGRTVPLRQPSRIGDRQSSKSILVPPPQLGVLGVSRDHLSRDHLSRDNIPERTPSKRSTPSHRDFIGETPARIAE